MVGLLLAALAHPIGTADSANAFAFAVALAGFVASLTGKIPAWAAVLAASGLGALVS